MTKTLNQLQPGQRGVVSNLLGSGALQRRILDLGLLPGTPLSISRVAPLGDPIAIRVRGAQLSLRRSEAESIWVDTGE